MYLQDNAVTATFVYINLQWGNQLNAFVVIPNKQQRQHPRVKTTSTMIPIAPQDRVQLDFSEPEVNSGDTSVGSRPDGVWAEVGSLSEI